MDFDIYMRNSNHSFDTCDRRIYSNNGNIPLIDLVSGQVLCVLDVGCGAGDNATLIKSCYPDAQVSGITVSPLEAKKVESVLHACWVCDIEADLPADLQQARFDTLIFSHVLEHLKNPVAVLARFLSLLQPGGQIVIAVPNVLNLRTRLQFMAGRFEYETAGILDNTHLRFFTYFTADRYLLADFPELRVVRKSVTGSVPLWWLRRYMFPVSWSNAIDRFGSRMWPNLFGAQVLIKVIKI
jgi:2-polyprenyl-3-methyl-5-hydroxy-6-metoxy-1,4-benzoquinol methylase